MVLWVFDRLPHGLHDVRRRWKIGVANAQVDDVHSFGQRILLGLVYGCEQVGWEVFYPISIHLALSKGAQVIQRLDSLSGWYIYYLPASTVTYYLRLEGYAHN